MVTRATNEDKKTDNPAETAGTVAVRAAGITPKQKDDEASPGADADKKQAKEHG